MRYRVLSLFLCVAAVLFASACSDNSTAPTDSPDTAASYYPTTKGSYWKIKSPGKAERITLTAMGDTTIAGKVYGQLLSSEGVALFIRSDNGDVYVRGMHRNTAVEVLYAKMSVGVGGTWSFSLPAFDGEYVYKCTVATMGTTQTVLGKEYNNVARIRYERSIVKGGTTTPDGGMEMYWARGVGPIATTPLDHDEEAEWELEDYRIE